MYQYQIHHRLQESMDVETSCDMGSWQITAHSMRSAKNTVICLVNTKQPMWTKLNITSRIQASPYHPRSKPQPQQLDCASPTERRLLQSQKVDSGMVILSMKHSSATTLNASQRRPIADTADSRSTPVMPLSLYHSETPCSCTIVAWPFMRPAERHHQPP
jgi:hypothetical protein